MISDRCSRGTANRVSLLMRSASSGSSTWTTLNLNRTDLRRGNLTGANLQRAALRGTSLARAWMVKVDLRGTDLRDADLRDATLRDAIADLTTWWPGKNFDPAAKGVFVHPNLEKADLRSAFLKRDDLTGARANAFTEWPAGFNWQQAGVIMEDDTPGAAVDQDRRSQPRFRHPPRR